MTVTRQCYCGRSRTSRRPRIGSDAGCTRSNATRGERKPFGAVTSITSHDCHGNARTCHRWRRSGRKAAARGTCASRMHGIRKMQRAGSPAVASRPAAAAGLSIWTRVYHPNMPDLARIKLLSARYKYAADASLMLDGASAMRLAPTVYRWTSRGRMRGLGATCTAPNDTRALQNAGKFRNTAIGAE